MKTIDKQTFESVVLSATSSTAHVFNMIQPHLDVVGKKVVNFLFGSFDYTTVEGLEDIAIRLVCLRTYHEQIPHLDLVLTPTGFGIVSNENVAPASPERVKALAQQVKDAYDDALDDAILAMLGTEWVKLPLSILYWNTFFITAQDLRDYACMSSAHRSALLEYRIQIAEAEEYIRASISSEYVDALFAKIASNELDVQGRMIVHELKLAIGGWINGNKNVLRMKLAEIINKMENNIDAYPEYKNSTAYQVKHFKRYENAKDDSTFFFG